MIRARANCGDAIMSPSLTVATVALAAGATAFLTATALAEERENLKRFGSGYQAYMRNTHRFIPFLFF